MLKKLGEALLPGASLFFHRSVHPLWLDLEVVRVRDALGQCDVAVLPGQREEMPHLDESQYVPLSRFLRLPRAVGDKVLAPLQHVFRRFLEAAVTLRLRRTPGMQGQESRRTRPRDNEWGG